MVTISDAMPAGLTATAASGTGWNCIVGATVTCTRSDILTPGSSYPAITFTVNVAANAPATITNTVTVSGGGDATPANNTASDPATIIPLANLTIAKTHSGNFTSPQTGATYSMVVRNLACAGPTTGTVTVSDAMPAGLTATAAAGTGWNCTVGTTVTCSRSDVLAPGSSYPAITLTVDVAVGAPATITNTAVVSGGGDVTPANNTASDPTTIIRLADLSITKTHSGNFTSPQTGAAYTIFVSNAAGAGPTAGMVTVSDAIPAGLTATAASGIGWNCSVGATVTCTRSDILAPGSSYPAITLTVNVAADAPATITNTVTVSGGGDVTPANNTASDPAIIIELPDLSITKTHSGTFTAPQTGAAYSIVVSNAAGGGPTLGLVTVSDAMPAGLTAMAASGAGWNCNVGATVTCTRTDALAPGSSYPAITLTVNVAAGAPLTIINTAVVNGPGDITPANNSASDPAIIVRLPDLRISKTHAGTLTPGQVGGTYTIVVSNAPGAGPSVGNVTVTDPLPASLTATAATGDGWNCTVGATTVCTRSDTLVGGASYPPIALTVNVAANAPPVIINTAAVSGAGDSISANDTAVDVSGVGASPDLTVVKSHTGALTIGQPATYSIVVSNSAAAGPTVGTVTLTDPLPDRLAVISASGTGWNCTVGAIVSCSRSDVLIPGSSYPAIALTANVTPGEATLITNVATVSGGADVTPANNSSTHTGPAAPPRFTVPPDLTISKAHAGTLTPGQVGAIYSILVSNAAAAGQSTGTVTVTDPLPASLTATAASGDGWTCALGPTTTCTRTGTLAPGANFPPITLTVNVAPDAPLLIINTATVSGGGDDTPENNTDADVSRRGIVPELTISKSHSGTVIAGQTTTFNIVVSNLETGGPTSGTVIVTDKLPAGLTAISASGLGWICSLGPTGSCARSDVLEPGTSYPPISLVVSVASSVSSTAVNLATVSGGGDLTPRDNTTIDPFTLTAFPDLTITKFPSSNLIDGQVSASYRIVVF
jgi:uncharacterized repeat protein (TIGR01451 family)